MKSLVRYALIVAAGAAQLVGCGIAQQSQDDVQPPIGAPGAIPQSRALAARDGKSSYRVVYRFNGHDGADPSAALIDVRGTLYGTTSSGGAVKRGVIFGVTKSGTEKLLYSVKKAPDGAVPVADLIDVKGTLYSTTVEGGGYTYSSYSDGGTVFSITASGAERVLHSFGSGTDGTHPRAGLINVRGTLYGTTASGGAHGSGTVFSITTSGSENVLYSFAGGTDGKDPVAPVIDVGGTFYGTTLWGGAYGSCSPGFGCGTVFSVTKSGAERVLHSFGYGTDGSLPQAGLIAVDGTLYGTTSSGGEYGNGTVFSITTSGSENVLYSFAGGSDGSDPVAGLINVGGTLYGTTARGGGSAGCYAGCGTVYSMSTSGAETVLHDFTSGTGGANPVAALLDIRGVLYGTTSHGGVHNFGVCHGALFTGCGTIFALSR